ncbi:MAG: SMP-30/gluconolactonase/LRE family protein [Desulfobacteraceae bacterium]|nr:SMP-30/gluconolactonase/LRE family protein [Desulfobacteraceae bacterium]
MKTINRVPFLNIFQRIVIICMVVSGVNMGVGISIQKAVAADMGIEQSISEEAQTKTIAFDGLAFLTGDACSDTFFPPGKVSDFFGFQYMRDNTPNGFGHNTEFAGRMSDSVLSILTSDQVQALVDLANTQADQVDAYGYKRFVLIDAFRRLLENDLPDGADGLDKSAVMEFSADLYEIDGEISYARAVVLGNIVTELTSSQKSALVQLNTSFTNLFQQAGEGGTIDENDWPTGGGVDLSGLTVTDGRVLVSTYASQLFSWYLGSVEGDTYFCPERHGTYFGSFYMKDIPPISATQGLTIDTNLTADMGTDFLAALDTTQKALITGLEGTQSTALDNIVSKRQEISQILRLFMDSSSVDKDAVLALVRQYGEYDGEIIYNYATNFAAVGNSLTNAQTAAINEIRTSYYERFPQYQADNSAYDCSGAWLYASKVDMPEIINTDFLFGIGEETESSDTTSVVADGAQLILLEQDFLFAEGPAVDSDNNLYFSDIEANLIYKWTSSQGLSVFMENSGGANGLFFDADDTLYICEGTNKQLTSIDSSSAFSTLAGSFNNLAFNEPNDLWVDAKTGVYFTDPVYNNTETQDGEHVYYLTPKRDNLIRVIDDMTRPNGIIGSPDGTNLYVTDHGARKTYQYDINENGTLSNKSLFVSKGGDGMTVDSDGNIYLCDTGVHVYDSDGNEIETISTPETPTNVCFGGADLQTLYITTRTSLYSLKMNVTGVTGSGSSDDTGSQNTKTPSGQVSALDLTFTWNEDENYTWYKLYIWDDAFKRQHSKWYRASKICSNGQCTVTLDQELQAGGHEWFIKYWSDTDRYWNDGVSFTVVEP